MNKKQAKELWKKYSKIPNADDKSVVANAVAAIIGIIDALENKPEVKP